MSEEKRVQAEAMGRIHELLEEAGLVLMSGEALIEIQMDAAIKALDLVHQLCVEEKALWNARRVREVNKAPALRWTCVGRELEASHLAATIVRRMKQMRLDASDVGGC